MANGNGHAHPHDADHHLQDGVEQHDGEGERNEEQQEQPADGEQQPKTNGAGLSRHGFDSSEETLRELESRYFLYYTDVS